MRFISPSVCRLHAQQLLRRVEQDGPGDLQCFRRGVLPLADLLRKHLGQLIADDRRLGVGPLDAVGIGEETNLFVGGQHIEPLLDVFEECGVKFALEVHPTEIAFDVVTAQRALETLNYRKEFGFNFDPSHLIWQGMDPAEFIRIFPDRIYHVHMKDAIVKLNGKTGILGSHLNFGDPRRGWDFRSLGHGGVDFEEIIRALNDAGYTGPLSVEWEDSGMDREHGAREALQYVRKLDFEPNRLAFDAAFDKQE